MNQAGASFYKIRDNNSARQWWKTAAERSRVQAGKRLAEALLLIFVLSLIPDSAQAQFKADQLRYSRVRTAFQEKAAAVEALFADKKLAWPPAGIFIRVFKKENRLELWARSGAGARFDLVTAYNICTYPGNTGPASGTLGPKRQEGDGQIPEGFYYISGFNPTSSYHLSLRIDYPNRSDRILGVQGRLGGDIFIHGACATIGCLPITDDKIKELYLAAVESRENGQTQIPVHIFPTRLNDEGMAQLKRDYSDQPGLIALWGNLKPGYDYFESSRQLPDMRVDSQGRYQLSNGATLQAPAWEKIADGLFLGEFESPQKSKICNYPIRVLKIDPAVYDLKLLSASERGGKNKTAKAWADSFGLVAVINASMYDTDHKTSTGYMKNFSHVNNGLINSRFGAFLAFNPSNKSVPAVQIIDRYHQKDWQDLINKYHTVIQNFRMISLNGKNTWLQSDKIYSIAAVAMDKKGCLLFIHSRTPFSVHDFNHILLTLPLNIRNAMYVEGGPEASLYVKSGDKERYWAGSYETGFFEDDGNMTLWPIPNVIGVVKKR